jgi:chorismate mutase
MTDNSHYLSTLNEQREKLNSIDKQITSLLIERFNITSRIMELKDKNDIDRLDSTRENFIINNIKTSFKDNEENINKVIEVYNTILRESKK